MGADVTEVTDANFSDTVGKSDKLFLIDFWAPWCAPCRALEPRVKELASDMAEVLSVGKLDIDQNQSTAQKFAVRSIPMLILFKGGEPVASLVGGQHTKDKLASWVKEHV